MMDVVGEKEKNRPIHTETQGLTVSEDGSENDFHYQRAVNADNNPDVMPTVTVDPYSTVKFSVGDWKKDNEFEYRQAISKKEKAQRISYENKRCIRETEEKSNLTQDDVTKRLQQRLRDIHFWKFQLQRTIQDVAKEIELLLRQKRRLELALGATDLPLNISRECLDLCQRRQHRDLVSDDVEAQLRKEAELIIKVQDVLRDYIRESDVKLKKLRAAKEKLELDWSDKMEAEEIETSIVGLKNTSKTLMFKPGVACFQDRESTPQTWAEFSQKNIKAAEEERFASEKLREMIDTTLMEVSRDMRTQADAVDNALERRITETEVAKTKLENHLEQVLEEIGSTETTIDELKRAIKQMEFPMKKAQTRLDSRARRPNLELCRDPAQFGLVEEVSEIADSVSSLEQQLGQAEQALKDLEKVRLSLEKDIRIKANTLDIFRGRCIPIRNRYPSVVQLSGY